MMARQREREKEILSRNRVKEKERVGKRGEEKMKRRAMVLQGV